MTQKVTVPSTLAPAVYLTMDNGTTHNIRMTSTMSRPTNGTYSTLVSTEWSTYSYTLAPNTTEVPLHIKPCLYILDKQIGNSRCHYKINILMFLN